MNLFNFKARSAARSKIWSTFQSMVRPRRIVLVGASIALTVPIMCWQFSANTFAAEESNLPAQQKSQSEIASTTKTSTVTHYADEQLVRKQAEDFARAFAAADAEAIANMCSEDCNLTDADGAQFAGRAEILNMYKRNFQQFGSQPIMITISSITFPASDVGIEDGELSFPKSSSTTRYTVVHIKREGGWKMLRITESPYNPKPAEALKPLNWLIGDWTLQAQNQKKIVHLKVRPIANQNFLEMRFSDTTDPASMVNELQLVGWSFKSKDIVSWHFGHEGGFGFGHWRRNGDAWLEETRGIVRDGNETVAAYSIKHSDNDHFSWQSAGREIAGTKLPNVGVVQAVRDHAEK